MSRFNSSGVLPPAAGDPVVVCVDCCSSADAGGAWLSEALAAPCRCFSMNCWNSWSWRVWSFTASCMANAAASLSSAEGESFAASDALSEVVLERAIEETARAIDEEPSVLTVIW